MDQEELDYLLNAVSALSSKPEKDPMHVLDLSPMSTLPHPVRLILKGWIRGLTSSENAAELLLQYDMDKDQVQTLLALTAWAQPGPCGCLGTA